MAGIDRRGFLKASMASVAAAALAGCASQQGTSATPKAAGKSVMGLVVPKMAEVRVGLIGVGERGVGFIHHFNNIEEIGRAHV